MVIERIDVPLPYPIVSIDPKIGTGTLQYGASQDPSGGGETLKVPLCSVLTPTGLDEVPVIGSTRCPKVGVGVESRYGSTVTDPTSPRPGRPVSHTSFLRCHSHVGRTCSLGQDPVPYPVFLHKQVTINSRVPVTLTPRPPPESNEPLYLSTRPLVCQ